MQSRIVATMKDSFVKNWKHAIGTKQAEVAEVIVPSELTRSGIPFGVASGKKVYFPPFKGKPDNRSKIIVGPTGGGKTTFAVRYTLERPGAVVVFIVDDGAAADTLLLSLPAKRLEKTVLLDHSNKWLPLPVSLPRSVNIDIFTTSGLANLWVHFFKTNFEVDGLYRTARLLQYACKAVFSVEGTVFYDVYRIIIEPDFREYILSQLDNSDVLQWWIRYNKKSDHEQMQIAEAFLNRSDDLFNDIKVKHTLGYPPSENLQYRRWMDEGYTVIIKAPETLGEDFQRTIMGIHAQNFYLAAISREDIPEADREGFMMLADEAPNWLFTSAKITKDIYSKGRKYGLGIMPMFQSFQQIAEESPALLKIIRDNQPDLITFRTSNERSPVKGWNMEELPDYHFVFKHKGHKPFLVSALPPVKPIRTWQEVQGFVKSQHAQYNVTAKQAIQYIERSESEWQAQSISDNTSSPASPGETKPFSNSSAIIE